MEKKHAYLIQVHNYPELLMAILKKLEHPSNYFFINIDKKSTSYPQETIDEILNNYQNVISCAKGLEVNHGGFSQIRSTLDLLKLAFDNKEHNFSYFHLISGQDYPVLPVSRIIAFFNDNDASYMQFDSEDEIKDWRKNKYQYRTQLFHFTDHACASKLTSKWNYYISKMLTKIFSIIPYRRTKIENLCGGWSWFSWHRNVASFVLSYLGKHENYLNRFKMTYCCDELIFHTILNDVTGKLNIIRDNSLRFVEWNPKRYTERLPLVLDEREFNDILRKDVIFIRKIDPVISKELINMVNKKLL